MNKSTLKVMSFMLALGMLAGCSEEAEKDTKKEEPKVVEKENEEVANETVVEETESTESKVENPFEYGAEVAIQGYEPVDGKITLDKTKYYHGFGIYEDGFGHVILYNGVSHGFADNSVLEPHTFSTFEISEEGIVTGTDTSGVAVTFRLAENYIAEAKEALNTGKSIAVTLSNYKDIDMKMPNQFEVR